MAKNLIIGFSGKMGSGKNYIAEKVLPIIMPTKQYYYMAFGDQIKIELGCRNKTLTYDQLFEQKTKDVRQLLQSYGTENGRQVYGEHIWIKALSLWMETFKRRNPNNDNIFVITDVRFKNEADWILEHKGLLIRVEAPSRNLERIKQESSMSTHISETELDNYPFKHIINNEPGMDVKEQLKDVLLSHNTIEINEQLA